MLLNKVNSGNEKVTIDGEKVRKKMHLESNSVGICKCIFIDVNNMRGLASDDNNIYVVYGLAGSCYIKVINKKTGMSKNIKSTIRLIEQIEIVNDTIYVEGVEEDTGYAFLYKVDVENESFTQVMSLTDSGSSDSYTKVNSMKANKTDLFYFWGMNLNKIDFKTKSIVTLAASIGKSSNSKLTKGGFVRIGDNYVFNLEKQSDRIHFFKSPLKDIVFTEEFPQPDGYYRTGWQVGEVFEDNLFNVGGGFLENVNYNRLDYGLPIYVYYPETRKWLSASNHSSSIPTELPIPVTGTRIAVGAVPVSFLDKSTGEMLIMSNAFAGESLGEPNKFGGMYYDTSQTIMSINVKKDSKIYSEK